MKNLPNTLTWIRIALIPLFVLIFYLPFPWAHPATSLIFLLAGLTDWLDGYYARKLNQTSSFGAFLDPVADKLMVAVALLLLVQADESRYSVLVALSAAIIIGREITISALREWMAALGERGRVAVSAVGKVKTTVQIIAIAFMLFRMPLYGIPIYEIGMLLLIVAGALTLWSMTLYLRAAWPALTRVS